METNKIHYSTWPNLWKFIGISHHSYSGYYYNILLAKLDDLIQWIAYWLCLSKHRPPLLGERKEDFYIRKMFSIVADCFARPICTAPADKFKIILRKPEKVGIYTEFKLTNKTQDAINFGSYNYLGFGGVHEVITPKIKDSVKQKGVLNSGSLIEKGITKDEEILEEKLAKFLHKEACVIVPMGFATNSTIIPIIMGKDDVIFSDALNHSSSITGMRSCKAEVIIFKHNDMNDLQEKLEDLKKHGMKNGKQPNKVLVVIEGLYSMEGEFCKLKEVIALKKAYGFYIYIDEAHSIGALGKSGRGITEHLGCNFDDIDILMGTFSKSFASAGGYVCSDKRTVEHIRGSCYSIIYGSGMSPAEITQISSSLDQIQSDDGERRILKLRNNAITFRKKLKENGCHVLGNDESPVIPVMIYHPAKIRDISRMCLKNGVAIVVVSYPACPISHSRIRFCMSAAHTPEEIEKTLKVTLEALKITGCIYGNALPPADLYRPPETDLKVLENLPKEPRKLKPLWETEEGYVPLKIEKTFENYSNCEDLVSYDIYNLKDNKERLNKILDTMNIYGCGSCGPRNFYGGTKEHLDLEEQLKKFFHTDEAIVYSFGNNVMTSVVPVYGQKKDVVLVDELANYPIQLGCRLAKGKIVKFKHNNFNDLKSKLDTELATLEKDHNITIVTEGVFQNDFSIAPLDKIATLRKSNVLLIVDDTLGIGLLGNKLKGTFEYYGLNNNNFDVLCASFEFIFDTVGGFVIGNKRIIEKQRLFGAGYIFSASAPPFTCSAGTYSLEYFEKEYEQLKNKNKQKVEKFWSIFNGKTFKNVELLTKMDSKTNLPFIKIKSKDGNDLKLSDYLKDNGFFGTIRYKIIDDWDQDSFVRMNICTKISDESLLKLCELLENY